MALLNANQINSGASLPYASERFAHVRGSKGRYGIRRVRGKAANADISLAGEGRVNHFIEITNGGSGYTSAPNVAIAAPPAGGTQAAATAAVTAGAVTSIQVTVQGEGYDPDNPPAVTITGGGGTDAAATATVDDGADINGRSEVLHVLLMRRNGLADPESPQDITRYLKLDSNNEYPTPLDGKIQLTVNTSAQDLVVVYQNFPDIT